MNPPGAPVLTQDLDVPVLAQDLAHVVTGQLPVIRPLDETVDPATGEVGRQQQALEVLAGLGVPRPGARTPVMPEASTSQPAMRSAASASFA